MFNDTDFEIGLYSDLASSLLPTLPNFGEVTLNFCILFCKRKEVGPTSQSCQQDSERRYMPVLLAEPGTL